MAVLSTSYEVESGFDTTLKTSISSTQTAGIIINKVPTITSGVLIFDAETAKEEWISFGGRTDNGNNTATLTDVTRGLNLTGDTFTGSATRAFSHSGGVCKVALVDYHSLFNLKANKDRDSNFTADQTFTKAIKFSGANARFELPRLTTAERNALTSVQNGTKIWNTTAGQEERYDSGSWIAVASGGTFPNGSETDAGKYEEATDSENAAGTAVGGTGADLVATPAKNAKVIQESAWVFKDSTGSSNAYVLTLTPAITTYASGQRFIFKANFANTSSATINVNGLGAKTIKKQNDQDLVSGDIESGQIVEIVYDGTNFQMCSQPAQIIPTSAQSTSGIANTTTTDQYMLSYNGNTRLDLADGNDSNLNQEWLLAGIANGASTSGNTQNYYPFGPIVTVPAFTLSQRANCRLWDGESNATSNTTSDTISAITAWRSESFVPQTGQDNVGAVVLNMTNSSLVATGSAQIYASTGASPDNIPTGAALGTSANVTSWSTGDITFTFATPVSVTPGTSYVIVFRLTAYTSGNIAWNYNNSSVYANGNSATSSNSGGSWTSQPTFDRRFKVQFRGIAGEPVYLSDTAGLLQLSPGTYNQQIGKAVSTTTVMLQERLKSITGTISATGITSTGSVDTEITLGFRPSIIWITSVANYGTGLAYPCGFFMANHASSNGGAGLSFYSTPGATANTRYVSSQEISTPSNGITLRSNDSSAASNFTATVTLSEVRGNTLVFNRNVTTYTAWSITITTTFIAIQ